MNSATLPLQEYKWPAFKVLSVLFLAFLFLSHGRWLEVIFDERVILPFMLLLITPALFVALRKENPAWSIIASCVPAGVVVGAFNLLEPLLDGTTAASIASPRVYSPIALGLVLSYSLRVFAPAYESKPDTTGVSAFWTCLISTVAIFAAYISLSSAGAELYINPRGFAFTLAVIACCFAFNDKARLTFGEVMARSGLFACLLAAVYAVTLYTAIAAIDDMKGIGPVMAESCSLLLYGALVAVAAGASGIRPALDRELMTRDWHLTEAYVFITLILFPPQTLRELLSASGAPV